MARYPHAPTVSFWGQRLLAIFAMVFGVLTLISGGSVLFGPAGARVWAGSYVGFVVWFNFFAGAVYVLAAIGLWQGTRWAPRLSALIAIATAVVAIGFATAILRGTAFEMRTVGALTLRFGFWAAVALIATRAMRPT